MFSGEFPDPVNLKQAFSWLDEVGYSETSCWPLFAARCWSWRQELRAWQRFRDGQCNVEEVAVPRWYWQRQPSDHFSLFQGLSLGRPPKGWPLPQPLREIAGPSGDPNWRVVPRFGRYILASLPHHPGDDYVYFGDDTLYLMQSGRALIERLSPDGQLSVLDLCCGGGGVGLGLPKFEGSLLGVDINPQAIALARSAAEAQGLTNYSYHLGSVEDVLNRKYDLIIGNPPSLPSELGGQSTVYATGSSAQWIAWLEKLLTCLSPTGRALLTVFSLADGPLEASRDPLRSTLSETIRRGYRYLVRRQFPMPQGRWLRHVSLEIKPLSEESQEQFVLSAESFQLPGLAWRRS